MSRRARQPAASRRTRRAEHPQPPSGVAAESPKIVSNPIFRCEPGSSQPSPPAPGGDNQLRCVYRPGSLYALVHDPAAAAEGSGVGKAKALPLPPCRAHPSVRMGPTARAVTVRGPHGCVLRRATRDPFLTAYVACSKSASTEGDRHRQEQKRAKKKKKNVTRKKCKEGIFRGCGIWNGWTVGAKCAGAMSCRYGCAVAAAHKGDPPPNTTKEEVDNDTPEGPTLNLSWAPVVLAARALERREQR